MGRGVEEIVGTERWGGEGEGEGEEERPARDVW